MTKDTQTHRKETPLQQWLKIKGIPSARLEAKLRERLLGRAPSRQQFIRWRLHGVEMRRKDMVRILWAAREVSQDETVTLGDLFNLDPASEEVWED